MSEISNPQLELAYNFVQYTRRNIFLTGKAGTGKTTFLRQLKFNCPKRSIVVAPTGVAAINAGGVTIHSFFQLPFSPNVPKTADPQNPFEQSQGDRQGFEVRMSREKINIMRSLDLLIIDEISMVRADLLDAIDETLRRYKRNSKPFGGVQLLMIGDIQQLPPVVKEDDWNLLKPFYSTLFFFGSRALQQTDYISIELKHIYRQSNTQFIEILNKIRDNCLDKASLDRLNSRYIANFDPPQEAGYITLTTHNRQAQEMNENKLTQLPVAVQKFVASITGDFPEYAYPTEKELLLKVGAQVMFVKNDTSHEKRYFNGKIGIVTDIEGEEIVVKCEGENESIHVSPEKWDNMKYSLNEQTKDIEEEVIGSFTQYPLKLAWAITIHKSQGLTFEKAIIYAGSAFAHGQIYVALSRCKSLEGLVLGSPIRPQGIINDNEVTNFNRAMEENIPDQKKLDESRKNFQLELLLELFDYAPALKHLYQLQRALKEHSASVVNSPLTLLEKTIEEVRNDLVTVSQKFAVQIRQLFEQSCDIETNETLQERIRKAATYFIEKSSNLTRHIEQKLIPETDNKAVHKAFEDILVRITDELRVKNSCLQAVAEGFHLQQYLEARAKALIDEPKLRKFKTSANKKDETDNLTNRLKQWRDDMADELGQIGYQILPQKTIAELVKKMPASLKQLKEIRGIGYLKINAFGKEILQIIADYQKDNNIKISEISFEEETIIPAPKKSKAKEQSSKEISLAMFKAGKSIYEIGLERGFASTTIEGHLAACIASGELSLSKLVSEDKARQIEDYFLQTTDYTLAPARQALGDDFDYREIRFVLSQMKHEGKIKQQ